jgi:hypothetical protein
MMTAPTIPTALSTAFPGTEGINKPAVVKHNKISSQCHNAVSRYEKTFAHAYQHVQQSSSPSSEGTQNLVGSTVQDAPEGQNRKTNIEHERIEN